MKQEYKLVRSYDPDGLSQTVSRYLNQGWQIEGNHQIASYGVGSMVYSQALILITHEDTKEK
jgi:hypothetical protein